MEQYYSSRNTVTIYMPSNISLTLNILGGRLFYGALSNCFFINKFVYNREYEKTKCIHNQTNSDWISVSFLLIAVNTLAHSILTFCQPDNQQRTSHRHFY